MTRLGGLGFLNSVHCEKTAFITFGALIATAYFVYLALVNNEFPTVTILDEPITLLFLAVLVLVFGYLGVIYYRITNGKRPIFVKKFWDTGD